MVLFLFKERDVLGKIELFKRQKRIAREKRIVKNSILFDAAYYKKQHGLKGAVDTAKHFCTIGWRNLLNPSRHFDVEFYLATYSDVGARGVNPLVHYLTDGAKEGRRPVAEFDGLAFKAAHPEHEHDNPAEACIARYGTYDWKDFLPILTSLPRAVVEAFRPYFDEAFYKSFNADVLGKENDCYDHFIKRGQYENRDPAPGFDIHAYRGKIAAQTGLLANPIYHFVKVGLGQGVQTLPADAIVLDSTPGHREELPQLTLGVHAHCYYPELITELLPRFLSFPPRTRFVATVVSEADRGFIEQVCKREAFPFPLDVRVVPNRGRDLAPFIVGCRDLWLDCDLLLHVHTKRSPHISWGDAWRRYLLDQTMGSRGLVDAVLRRFTAEPDLGCLYPRNYCAIRRHTLKAFDQSGIGLILSHLGQGMPGSGATEYPAGSMAWYRTAPLRPFVEAFGSLAHFEDEAQQVDATFAHALERGLPLAVRAAGSRVVSYVTPVRVGPASLTGLPEREDSAAAVPARWHRDTPWIARQAPKPLAPLFRTFNPRALDIHWILPSFGPGAGGHMTIFRIVELLERFGHRQTLWLQNAVQFRDQAEAKRRIQQWYRPVSDRLHVRFLPEDVRELAGDVLIATDCWTAFPAAQTTNFKERFYFVQDHEPSFHPTGEMQLIAESTYEFGFPTLCAGRWLEGLMRDRGLWARSWDLCADHDVYYPGTPRARGDDPVRIAFYARPYTPRRAVALGFAAFEELHRRGVRLHVELFGEANLKFDFAFPHTQHGILTPAELADLYRESDLGVVFSTTNYSLIPLEMMACNLPVVEIDAPSTRAIFRGGEVTFTKQAPYQIADAIQSLIADPERQARQVRQGRAFVDRTSWETSARAIEAGLLERLDEIGCTRIPLDALAKPAVHAPRKATVFIPTYNAGPDFQGVLNAVTRQVCDFAYDVLIIDSGSSDDTLDRARPFTSHNLHVETIPNAEFQHGRTRNRGIAQSDGEYVAILTQDACPKDERWLANLIAGFNRGPKVAGVIGRHEAYPAHDVFTKRDMTEMFDGLALLPAVTDREIGLPSYIYPGGRMWRMLMQFYSDNNSAIWREAWKIIPYPEIAWGEDQVWADEMLRVGFQKAYVDDAIVFHSHAFDLENHTKTATTEGQFWGQYFGFDLHPDATAAIAAMDARDRAYAIRAGADATALEHRQLLNRATVNGRIAGYRASQT
ncbi:D-inositol-3-phosphate glycosyltransferase [Methylobacterium persicinum]|nr:D-inositol-3-phosphate glycosyltransferase [Methylobacterium persicinum]